jgi:hypothetical protein
MTKKPIVFEIDANMDGVNNQLESINSDIGAGKHAFIFLFMDGCGPCNQTKPQWKKMQNIIKKQPVGNEDLVVAAINQKLFERLNGVGSEPIGYPCLRYVKGPNIEEYEDCSIANKDRSTDSFIEWIESKIKKQNGGRRRKRRGGKWSIKYKQSINCRRPKGFSQRQHCKYGRKTLKHKY